MLSTRRRTGRSPGKTRALTVLGLLFGLLSYSGFSRAETAGMSDDIPHVSNKAKEDFQQYQYAGRNRAFAIAPGGAWAWLSDLASPEQAGRQAIEKCQSYTRQKCVLYALNDRVVFDRQQWPTLWGPYADTVSAAGAEAGTAVGQRFYDLAWTAADGKPVNVSSLKGKLVLLHFWGSWCPPCLREFPSLKAIYSEIRSRYPDEIDMVMLQLRESFDESKMWVEQHGFSDMPLYDSGVKDSETATLSLSDGRSVEDRSIARVFPSTYVLDRNGLVIFSHNGPVSDWLEYLPFIEHAIMGTKGR